MEEIIYTFAALHINSDQIWVNAVDPDTGAKLIYLLDCPTKIVQPESVKEHLDMIKAVKNLYGTNGVISGKLSHSSNFEKLEGNLCNFTMTPSVDGFTCIWSLKVVLVFPYDGDKKQFPYTCYL